MNFARGLTVLPVLGMMVGCAQPSPPPPKLAQTERADWTVPVTPQHAKEWTPEEAKAVLVARAAVEQMAKLANAPVPDIMEFRVTPELGGWSVYVQYVGAYVDGKAYPAPGFFAVVEIGRDWNVRRIVGGA
jgi:hypothetical protein